MHARVVTAQIRPGKTDQMLKIYQSVINVAKEQKGFKGILSLTNRNTNKAISISLWENEDDMKAGETSGYLKEQIAKVAAQCTFDGTPVTEHYEVSIQELS